MLSTHGPRSPIVAIGASAGGLEALLQLLPALTPNGRTRYILAQHMSRDGHTDLVVRVLARHTSLKVVEAANGQLVDPDVLYVLPAGTDGLFDDGRLHLRLPPPGAHSSPSVDLLLESVARSAGSDAYAVVLSGAGSDGTAGCREVRAHGGTVIVQDRDSSAIYGMAGAIAASRLADHALVPAAIGEFLSHLVPAAPVARPVRHPYTGSPKLAGLLDAMSERSGVDFRQYRQGTLLRRMERRASELRFTDLDAYIAHCRTHPSELDSLQRLFLISWSWFFRDRAAWEQLRIAIEAQLVNKPAREPYRVWVPGCAGGEECYSIAMLLADLAPERSVEVIGSDLNPEAIATARNARFSPSAFREMPAGYVERFTAGAEARRRIVDELRSQCVFREEDALTARPAGTFDLVSCRNLLIYMKRELHEQLLGHVHEMLGADGLLFLGMSEGLGRTDMAMFDTVDSTYRIYRRRVVR